MDEMQEVFSVREGDIDGNAHMNNAVYVDHFGRAADRVFHAQGFGNGLGSRPFLRSGRYAYSSQVWFGEVARILSSFSYLGAGGIFLNQKMVCSGEEVARADLEYGLVRASAGTPQDHPGCAKLFEERRRKFVEENGLGARALRERGFGLFVRRASYSYTSPFLITDPIIISSWKINVARVISEQEMVQEGNVLARANLEYVFVNLKTGRATRPPKDLVEKLKV